MRRLNVLVIAYACSPSHGSEAGVGWGWVNAIAERHHVAVITADYNASEIDRHLTTCPEAVRKNARFIYVKNRPWHYRPWGMWVKVENSLAKPLMNLAYQNWLGFAFAEAQQEIAQNGYDLVHLITYVGWRFSGRFYQLGIPFVWGPIGGLKNTPWNLFPALGIEGAIYYAGRNLINSLQIRSLPGPRRALRKAQGAVIAATSEISGELQKHFRSSSRVICEVGMSGTEPVELKQRESDEPLRICWSGIHHPGKALPLLLRAAARLPKEMNYSLRILGDGPSHREWRALATRINVENRCHWYGHLSRDRALNVMRSCHVFAITSLKELTSTVTIEAISLGLPIVCLDHCGVADLVTGTCGIKISTRSIRQIESDIAEALTVLYRDEPLRYRLAKGAIERSLQYSWQSKMPALEEVYGIALSRNGLAVVEERQSVVQLMSQSDSTGSRYV